MKLTQKLLIKNSRLIILLQRYCGKVALLAFVTITVTGCLTETVYRPQKDLLQGLTVSQAEDNLVQGLKFTGHADIDNSCRRIREIDINEKGIEVKGVGMRRGKETTEPFVKQVDFAAFKPYEVHIFSDGVGASTFIYQGSEMKRRAVRFRWDGLEGINHAKSVADAMCVLEEAAQQGFLTKMSSLEEFYAKANVWRALPQKPPLPESVRRFMVMAEDCVKSKDFPNAIKNYMQAVQLEPLWPPAHYNLAILMGEHGKYDKAIYHLRCYLALLPDASNSRAVMDQIYVWEGKRGGSVPGSNLNPGSVEGGYAPSGGSFIKQK